MLKPAKVIKETPLAVLFLKIEKIWGINRRALTNRLIENPNSTNDSKKFIKYPSTISLNNQSFMR